MRLIHKNTRVNFTSNGRGPAVVLVHGFLENSSMWEAVSAELSKKYRVICIDLLGHGATESHGYMHTMEDQAELIKAVLDHLKLRKYRFVGHSMGGYVALTFAQLFPETIKGLCLMNSTALPDTEEKKINRDRGIKAVQKNHKLFIQVAIPMLFSEENRAVFTTEIKKVTEEALKMTPQGIIAALEGMKIRKDLTAIYKAAKYPIAMIIGKQDPALDYNSLIAQTKNTNVEVIEFSDGHMSHIENKIALIAALQQFLKNT